jgi:hypothetical protein
VREQQQQRVSSAEESYYEKPYEKLARLVPHAAQERDRDEQRRITTELIDTLIAMRAPGDEAEEAAILIAHLDGKTLEHLVDEKGRRARREAVATLLSLGFPHALKVSPEDLEQYRIDETSVGAQLLARQELVSTAGKAALWIFGLGGSVAFMTQSLTYGAVASAAAAFMALAAFLPASDD